ncbi:MAG TPA: protease complex subunit PrcB family protein [Gammaproteobacteria bacterium]
MKRLLIIVAALAAGLVGCASGGGTEVNGATILQTGPHSAVKDQGTREVHDQAALDALWKETYATASSPPEMPTVDFTKQTVVAYFLGEMKHGGFKLSISRAEPSPSVPNSFDVDVTVIKPGDNCHNTTQDITHPYLIAVVPVAGQQITFDTQSRQMPPCT